MSSVARPVPLAHLYLQGTTYMQPGVGQVHYVLCVSYPHLVCKAGISVQC